MCEQIAHRDSTKAARISHKSERIGCIWNEARLLMELAVPTALVQLATTMPNALTASYVGRLLGSQYLDGFTLATLTGNLLSLSLLFGLYTAADTLSPQAFSSGNFEKVGLLAIRGFVVGMVIILPINAILWKWMHVFLIDMNQDVESSKLASEWFRIYVWGIPFYALFVVTWKFLSAQAAMWPLVVSCLMACGLILPLSLKLCVSFWGFRGSALAVVMYQAFQALFLVILLTWRKPFHSHTWPGLARDSWRRALEWKPVLNYVQLGCGGILSMSEWWYWEVVALMVGTFGVVPLSVHTIPTQVITVSWMVPLSIGTAMAVRLGTILPHSVKRAKRVCLWTNLASAAGLLIASYFMYAKRQVIFRWFTVEAVVLQGCEEIWADVVEFSFFLGLYGLNMGTAFGLGMQWTLGVVTTFFFWVVGLPCLYYFASIRGGGITAVWSWMSLPYISMNVVLWCAFSFADWDQIQNDIRVREGMVDAKGCQSSLAHYGSIEIAHEKEELLVDKEQEEKKAEV